MAAGISSPQPAGYTALAASEGYAAAIAAMVRDIAGAKEAAAAEAAFQEEERKREEANRKLAEQWLADNAKHTQAEMAEAQAEQQRKDAEYAEAAAEAEKDKPWWETAFVWVPDLLVMDGAGLISSLITNAALQSNSQMQQGIDFYNKYIVGTVGSILPRVESPKIEGGQIPIDCNPLLRTTICVSSEAKLKTTSTNRLEIKATNPVEFQVTLLICHLLRPCGCHDRND